MSVRLARLGLSGLTSRRASLDALPQPGGLLALGPVEAGRHILTIERTDPSVPFVSVLGPTRPRLFLPALERTTYLLDGQASIPSLLFRSDEVTGATLRPVRRADLPLLLRARRDRGLLDIAPADGASLLPLLRGGSRGSADFARSLRLLFRIGFGAASPRLQVTLARRGRPAPTTPRPPVSGLRLGVVLHLFHPELWDEMAAHLACLPAPFCLIVTGLRPGDPVAARISAAHPGAEILAMANRGRDVGPFVEVLRQGRLDTLDLVLKLHGKRSAPTGPRALLGEVWRHACLQNLAGSPALVEHVIARFQSDAGLGMVGPRLLRMPNAEVSLDAAWGHSRAVTAATASLLKLNFDEERLDFFAGTMAWIRPAALTALRSSGLSLDDFPEESGQVDGTLQHALERLLPALPAAVGMRVDDSDLDDVGMATDGGPR